MKNHKIIPKLIRIFLEPVFLYLAIGAIFLLLAATLLIYYLEKGINPNIDNYFDSLWWGVATMTTIGYGDIVPITLPGRIVGVALMFTGPVLFVLFTGVLLKSIFQEQMEQEIAPLDGELRKEIQETQNIEKLLSEIIKRLERLEKKTDP